MAIIGIDLGTTNSLAVAYIEDHYELIPNQFNEYLTPSVVSIDDTGSIYVGKIAKERLVTHPTSSASLFKRNMGKIEKNLLNNKEYLPEYLSALVVKQLIEDAKRYLKEDVEEVVISVPAYFNEFQRAATKRIGELLNIKVERLINEPSAAALAAHEGNIDDEAFIVFDFGGGTLDVSVVDCFDNVVSICAIAGDNQLGGSDFDKLIAKDICTKYNIDFNKLSPKQQHSILSQCENMKKAISESYSITREVYIDNKAYEYILTRDKLKEISSSLFIRMRKVIANAVNSSGFEKGEIDKLVLVGGSCHMPIVCEFLEQLMNVPIVEFQDMDQVVAIGLGTYIGIKQRKEKVKQLVLTDICPFSLGTGVYNRNEPDKKLYDVLISKNTVLPTSRKKKYITVEKGQTAINFEIYQGEGMYVKDNILLGNFVIDVPKNMKANEEVEITFSYDINSILCIDSEVLSTHAKKRHFIGGITTTSKHVEEIIDVSIKLNLEPQVEYVRERLLRLLEESSVDRQLYLRELYERFEILLNSYGNNLRKKTHLINDVENIINNLEEDNLNSYFFNDDMLDDEDDGGLLS